MSGDLPGLGTIGLLLFDDFPDALTWLGIAVIVGSGLYVFHRERTREREAADDAT